MPKPLPQPVRRPRAPARYEADRRVEGRLAADATAALRPQPVFGRTKWVGFMAEKFVGRLKQVCGIGPRRDTVLPQLIMSGKVPYVDIARKTQRSTA